MSRAFWKRVALAGVVLVEGAGAVSAATSVCTDLQAKLDALNRSSGTTSDAYRTYDSQVTQQKAAFDKATNDARAAGCYGGLFSPKPSPSCPQMIASLNAMQTNLAKVTAVRDQYRTDPNALTNQKNDLMRLQALNRCVAAAPSAPGPGNGGVIATLFGGGIFGSIGNGYIASAPYSPYGTTYGNSPYSGYGATYRTMCVRSCDGYYFPISFETTADQFASDQQTCNSMCPGSPVSLYVYRNPGDDVDAMVSLSGAPYSASPTAYKYRTAYNPTCGCGSASTTFTNPAAATTGPSASTPGGIPGLTLITPVSIPSANAVFTPLPQSVAPLTPATPIPALRPAVSEDPETLADRAGKLTPLLPAQDPGTRVAAVTADGRSIRIIGPSYYVAR